MMLNAFLRRGRDRSWANRRKRQQWRLLVEREAARRLRHAWRLKGVGLSTEGCVFTTPRCSVRCASTLLAGEASVTYCNSEQRGCCFSSPYVKA